MSLRIRRGMDLQRRSIIFDPGEVVYTTDTKKLFIGDGATAGGVNVLAYMAGSSVVYNSFTHALDFNPSGLTTTNIAEGNNLYYTSDRAKDAAAQIFTAAGAPTASGTITGTISPSTLTLNSTIGLVQGERIVISGGGLGGGLTAGTYYVCAVTNSTRITISTTQALALAGTAITSFTTATISGTWTAGGTDTGITFVYDNINRVMSVTSNGLGITSVSQDTSPQLGGNLNLNSRNITGTGNINITGNLTASGTLSVPKLAGNLNIDTYSINGIDSTVLMSSVSGIMTLGNAALPEIRMLGSLHTIQSQTSQSVLTLQSSIGATPGSTYTANTDISYLNFKAWSTVGSIYKQVSTATISVDGNIGGTNDLPGRLVLAVGGQATGTQQYVALNSYGYLAGPLGLSLTALTNATTSAFAAGAAYLPAASVNGTIIYNSDAGTIQAYINGSFRNFVSYSSAAPATSKGATGDRKGMVFATSAYVYTCYADYTNGTPDIWARTATTGSTF